ncbi:MULTISPECIES: aspartate-semialdehyde dehydrogenase [Streptomyces]|uniref:Aspartate-semialdehyde dehydrogenase n=3 Tax=Streptomyces griseoaurantiacus TaxID=68213 RepID=F3NLS9_9ACTN|nr:MULTISPECIES: aspartate-semialdehyde dehydrogenase [Streptomyces]EGG45479.1 aspartate-semialdehyde dehydrogenase [Streptomyces griseoaurantiacus M045]MBA5221587.1 aspartate-semialdehyde dehydrogenase [Streptomyces griseoaurantiacus]MCF0085524.1 Aspartate-semialdehyde dehydrogenase [Streptomyces sp. MH192]MCF0098500.1 Aspartate-semialdehyde dehydrogenase [Streptomyces sp. MH191]MDX3087732.1 aspartate-semialdehyde dehydrogenase [Streptomyces sp. ME12-02E]
MTPEPPRAPAVPARHGTGAVGASAPRPAPRPAPSARQADKPVLAVVGATGTLGTVMLRILSQRADIWGEIRLLASPRSAGRKLTVRGEETEVAEIDEAALTGVDVALFCVPDEVAREWAPVAAARGAVAVDNSAAFRTDPEVPLVVPEVNAHTARVRPRGILASPGCATLTMIVAMGALHAEFGLRELVLSSYHAVSGAGRGGVETLREQLALVAGTELGTNPGDVRRVVGEGTGPFPEPVALNVVPWAGTFLEDGWSSEEAGLREETRKVLGLPQLPIAVTCVRVPVVTAHSLTVHAGFENEVTVDRAREILATAPGVVLCDEPAAGEFPTPADVVGTDPSWVGRVRRALDDPTALDFFVCADNLRKGGALNAVQIAELVVTDGVRTAPGPGHHAG